MRVVIDARLISGASGGVEQSIQGLAAGLSDRQTSDEFVFVVHEHDDAWLRPHARGCRIVTTPGPSRAARARRRARLSLARRAPRLLAWWRETRAPPAIDALDRDDVFSTLGADVVHFMTQRATATDIPSIYGPYDLQHVHFPEFFSSWEHGYRQAMYGRAVRQATAVTAMTPWAKADFVEHLGVEPEKVVVVPWAGRRPTAPSPTPVPPADRPFALYPAQSWQHKNHLRLLEAIALLRSRDGVVVPLIATGARTPHSAVIDEAIGRLGLATQVRFPGFVSEHRLRDLYATARMLVFPSLFEGWGLPVAEAMSDGLPVACSTATSLPDLVGDAAVLFDPTSVEAMAEAIRRVWTDDDLRTLLAERGRRHAATYSWARTAQSFVRLYRDVANGTFGASAAR